MAWVMPPVFFLVAAFLVNLVLARLIALERSQIGLLKAIGYSELAVAGHYLKLAAAIGGIGIAIGWGFGWWAGQGMTRLYGEFFRFPYLVYVASLHTFAISALAGFCAPCSPARSSPCGRRCGSRLRSPWRRRCRYATDAMPSTGSATSSACRPPHA